MTMMKTQHTGGGAWPETLPEAATHAPSEFVAPQYIDSRPYCLEASDQGFSPACCGFAVAGLIEVMYWKKYHRPQQFDGMHIYKKAKTMDGSPDTPGTYIRTAVLAAQELGLITDVRFEHIGPARDDYRYGLHEFGVMLGSYTIDDNWNRVNTDNGFIDDRQFVEKRGGHAVLDCWYHEDGPGWQNSWDDWGWHGFGRMTWDQYDKQRNYGIAVTAQLGM